MIRIVLVDDQQLLRRGLGLLFETIDDVEVVGEAAVGKEALAVIARVSPDVVLTDARMPVMDGVELVGACRAQHPGVPVLVLTTFDDDTLVRGAIRAGAAGFLLKDSSPEALAEAIRSAHAGGLVIDPRVARAAMSAAANENGGSGTDSGSALAVLTPAERAVAGHVAMGATNGEIAATLVLSEGTVKNHVSSLLRKLGHRDRTALALFLHRTLHA